MTDVRQMYAYHQAGQVSETEVFPKMDDENMVQSSHS